LTIPLLLQIAVITDYSTGLPSSDGSSSDLLRHCHATTPSWRGRFDWLCHARRPARSHDTTYCYPFCFGTAGLPLFCFFSYPSLHPLPSAPVSRSLFWDLTRTAGAFATLFFSLLCFCFNPVFSSSCSLDILCSALERASETEDGRPSYWLTWHDELRIMQPFRCTNVISCLALTAQLDERQLGTTGPACYRCGTDEHSFHVLIPLFLLLRFSRFHTRDHVSNDKKKGQPRRFSCMVRDGWS
jgi:hypothetical protein